MPLECQKSGHSLTSEILEQKQHENDGERKDDFLMYYLFKRLGALNRESWKMYGFGVVAAVCNGMMYPSYSVVFSKAINMFSETNLHQHRYDGDHNVLYFFIIAKHCIAIDHALHRNQKVLLLDKAMSALNIQRRLFRPCSTRLPRAARPLSLPTICPRFKMQTACMCTILIPLYIPFSTDTLSKMAL